MTKRKYEPLDELSSALLAFAAGFAVLGIILAILALVAAK